MKIKDLERTANVAWSPKNQSPIYLASGTAAQQLDASFNTTATLEIHNLNLNEPGPDLIPVGSVPSEQRFHRIIWGEQGTIVGACDSGLLQIYSADKLIKGDSGLICKQERHTGHVNSLDFNPFQQNLFASGAGDSEIFIWDLNNVATPMSPGAKSQPFEDVLSVAWNRQVQHILASTFTTKCVIWDLRKEHPIIKLTDTVSRVRWKMVAWHPDVATQLCLASEEDHSPIIQLWDLRFATSPLKTLENHQRGILSLAWCNQDPDLLISCGKDNRIICWNPNSNNNNSGEVLSEIAKTNEWNFDLQWCPRNPAIIASSSFDGHVSIYSIMGGKLQQIHTSNKIADSFPGINDGYLLTQQQQSLNNNNNTISMDLSKPPKWLKRPVGAKFGFGGKLIWFNNNNNNNDNNRTVHVDQIVTEQELVEKANELEQALEYGNFIEYCKTKAEATDDQHKKFIWYFLKANFEENPRIELLNLLGYHIDDVNAKLNQFIGKKVIGNNITDITEKINNLNRIDSLDPFDSISEQQSVKKSEQFLIKTGDDTDGLITQALLLGNVEAAVELCLKAKRYADAIIIAMTGGSDLLARTQRAYLEQCDSYVSSIITALITENWHSVITNCDLNSWKEALAATLTHSNDETLPILCEKLGDRLASDVNFKKDSQLCYICAGSFDKLVKTWSDKNVLNSTTDLQELIELVNFLQKSIETHGKNVQITGGLAQLYSYYASLLASQGKLNMALNYLGNSQDKDILELKDRLTISLGQKTQFQPQQNRRNSVRQPNYSVGQPQQFNVGLPSNAWQQQTFSAIPPPSQPPPRPTSVGLNQATAGLPTRKYVLDPSVASNQYQMKNYCNQPPGTITPPTQFTQTNYANQNAFPVNPPQLFTPQQSCVANPVLNPTPLMPSSVPPPIHPPYQFSNSGVEVAQTAVERQIPSLPVASGWNDPPVLRKMFKSQLIDGDCVMSALHAGTKLWKRNQQKQENNSNQPIQPILHPFYGGSANGGSGDAMDNNNTVPQIFQPPPVNNFAPPLAHIQSPPLVNNFNPSGFKQNAIISNYGHNQQQQQQQQPTPMSPSQIQQQEQTPIIQKLPIPEEHLQMQVVFDSLKNQCTLTANNPQTKRKLEDVGRKLEALYDLLREHKLSSTTLASLHQMVQLIQNGDYTNGLNLHMQLVSGPDFAQIASFMPGLKVLLQCALQLQVYLT